MKSYFTILILILGIAMSHASTNHHLSTKDQTKICEILSFWFGTMEETPEYRKQMSQVWFSKNPEFDNQIRERFENTIQQAGTQQLNHWSASPKCRLAMIILLDQFTRNIYRGSPKAYKFDDVSLCLVLEGIQNGADKQLNTYERLFFYLPLEHSENLEMQNLSMKKYQELHDEAPEHLKKMARDNIKYAEAHHVIIKRFGRFPHRNKDLGRESTPEEVEFLTQPGSSF